MLIDYFTAVCLVAWSLNESEAEVDIVSIETSVLFLRKIIRTDKHEKSIIKITMANIMCHYTCTYYHFLTGI